MAVELQVLKEKCTNCRFYQKGTLYSFCTHNKAGYIADYKKAYHTIQHMRAKGQGCGELGLLFQGKNDLI